MPAVYYAKWLLSPACGVISHGAVRVDGSVILEAGARSSVGRAAADHLINLGDVMLMPGLINMHTHLEEGVLRGIGREPEETFASWMAKKTSRLKLAAPEALLSAVQLGIRESLAFGTTTIVDSSRTGASLPVLKDEPIRAWVIQEIGEEEQDPGEVRRLYEMRRRIADERRCIRIGVGPHALFSLTPQGHAAPIDIARSEGCLWACHIAESAEELQAFSEQSGDLFSFITRRRAWGYEKTGRGPLHHALTAGLIPDRAALFHCNYAGGHELALLSAKQAAVVICPQYTMAMGHKRLPLDVALSRKVTICVGTECQTDAQPPCLFDELHCLKRLYPHIPAQEMLRWVTVNPASALGMQGSLGVLAPGACADMIAMSFAHDPGEDPLEELLQEQPAVRFVMVNGEEVIVDY